MNAIPELRQMMHQLVAEPSVSSEDPRHDGGNRAVIEQLAGWLEPLGFACELMPVRGRDDKLNLIATRGHGDGGLVLSGHADTVPWDDSGWHSDPFDLSERDQRLYGLGICDMKGFLAMAVQVAAETSQLPLAQPLILLATADEESGMDGARALVEARRPLARHAVIGEPTGMRPIRLHKGILLDAIRVHGRAGHSSRPDLGANAIEGMQSVLQWLLQFRQELAGRTGGHAFALDHPTLNLGCLHGGDSANRIPGHCELRIDLRYPPGHDGAALRRELRERLADAFEVPGCRLDFDTVFDGVPAFETPIGSDIVRQCERLTGHDAGAVDFATEGEFFNQLGMQTLILGPGDIDQAHQPNEYLALDRIEPMLDVLRALVRRYCLAD